MNDTKKVTVAFAAIDPYIERTMPLPVEKSMKGRGYVEWGSGNAYPDYLLDLYNNVPTLRTIVNGNVDFIAGDDLTLSGRDAFNRKESVREQVRKIARDYEIYGGFALQVIRAHDGSVAEVYHIDIRFLRCDKECQVFRYNEAWNKGGRDAVVYPAFMPDLDWDALTPEERDRHASSILYVKNEYTQTYPAPLYAAAVKDCETERCVTDYHFNAINSGFASSMIINFNNGQPSDEDKEEIERDVNEKFSGHTNAGRVMLSFNPNKENATTFEVPKVEDFGEKYKALSTHCRQQIFASFRAIPALFGIMTESTGFNSQEFEQAYRLYYRTQIRPVQRLITEAYERIYQDTGVLTIKPFTIDEDTADTNVR